MQIQKLRQRGEIIAATACKPGRTETQTNAGLVWEKSYWHYVSGGCVCPKEQLQPKDQPYCRCYRSLGDSNSAVLCVWLFCVSLSNTTVANILSVSLFPLSEPSVSKLANGLRAILPTALSDQSWRGRWDLFAVSAVFLVSMCLFAEWPIRSLYSGLLKQKLPGLRVRSLGSWRRLGSTPR